MTKPVDTKQKQPSAFAQPSAPPSSKPMAVLEQRVLTPKLAREYARLRANDDLHFSQEKQFFIAQVRRSKELQAATPGSLAEAFRQAASIGLSFNPQLGHVYLIPRRNRKRRPNETDAEYAKDSFVIAYASPGYRGLIHLALLGGAIKWARAEVVHERDHFRYFGPTTAPEFIAGGSTTVNSLTVNRGAKVGVFCHARTPDGDDLCDMMDAATIGRIRSKSENRDALMWTVFEEEGWKKAVLRRASKTWPHFAGAALLQRAVEILNDNEGLPDQEEVPPADVVFSPAQINELHAKLTEAGIEGEKAARWLVRLAGLFGCKKIEDVPAGKFAEAKKRLTEALADHKPEKGNETAPAA